MFKRIKQFFENLAYAGLKPQGGRTAQTAPQRQGFIRAWAESRLTKGGPPTLFISVIAP